MLTECSASEIHRRILAREVSCEEVVQAHLERIDAGNPKLNAFLCRTPDLALETARAVDARVAQGKELGPLAGVPVAIKDNISVPGAEVTCGSRILKGYRPIYGATVYERMLAAGLPCLGKTNMDEFAMGSSTEHSAFGATSNPWDLERVPGGSSGGSAAAVAAGLAPVALGSDTGGSVRQPAALCGIVGLKPTYGAVSRYGLVAFASSLDQIGPFGRTVEDCARLFDVIRGRDPKDSTSVDYPGRPGGADLSKDLTGLRVGVPEEMLGEGIDAQTRAAVQGAVRQLEKLGAKVGTAHLPHLKYSIATYYVIACAEASSNLARYDGIRYGLRTENAPDLSGLFENTRGEGFNPEVKRRIILGTYVLSSGYYDAYYLRAQKVRTLIRRDFLQAHADFDVLAGPVSPTSAFRKGEKSENPLEMYLADICTLSANLAGIPGLSMPCGFSNTGLPIGLQLLGRPFAESQLFNVAHCLERELGVASRRPAP
ncbi:MAG: Asp-tRNA(Asn)/Glu-tRNA(Gln) amidotransferase subunit GatA [Candidatus Wallbacteria bacterium]|nr:Asp-tRNA(Asn)/Glu-tRNA(Gln) amidotransferase subunit GatA [Candidatus Wallbacteria bacterium]